MRDKPNQLSPLNIKQIDYIRKCNESWFNVAEGGKRGGKNVINTLAFCIALENHPDKIHLAAGVSIATARLNIIDCDGYGLKNYFFGRCRDGIYNNRSCLYLNTIVGEKVVLISGGGKQGDEKLIKGNSYGMVYITEANECSPVFIKEAFDRTLSSKKRHIYHDLNPKAEGHWYYHEILELQEQKQAMDDEYGYHYQHFTLADNMSISDQQLHTIVNTYDQQSVWYQRDILGKRKQAEGLVYPMFDPKRNIYPEQEASWKQSGVFYVSIDYGTVNPFSAGLWKIAGRTAYRIKELYYNGKKEQKQKTDEEYYQMLEQLIGNRIIDYIVVDPSAASFITLIRRKGKYAVKQALNDVINGIRLTANFIKSEQIQIDPSCIDSLSEYGLYSWDEKSPVDKVIQENDHAMDDTRYFVATILARELM